MSNLSEQCEQASEQREGPGGVDKLIEPRLRELGGFSVRRLLPTVHRRMVGPWIFFDHMGPASFAVGEGVDVGQHPHIGIATVTYLFTGEILHRDSLGTYQAIQPGDINLMVAGRGIVHSERERPELRQSEHSIHGLQLWLALPEDQEEIDPAFYHYPAEDIPLIEVEGVAVCVMMGSAFGVSSPVRLFSETLYLEARLAAGQKLTLPPAEERAVYIVEGSLQIEGSLIAAQNLAVMNNKADIVVEAEEETRIVMIGGEHFKHRYVDWNFVSSRQERIDQAKLDWQENRFLPVPGDVDDYIPLPSR